MSTDWRGAGPSQRAREARHEHNRRAGRRWDGSSYCTTCGLPGNVCAACQLDDRTLARELIRACNEGDDSAENYDRIDVLAFAVDRRRGGLSVMAWAEREAA